MAETTWYKLDNVGKFYAAQAGRAKQTVFRLSASLTDDVDEACLQEALDGAMLLCPGFNVTLRSGFFWHYLEQSELRPMASPEQLPPCFRMHEGPASVLFRVSYFATRINLEVSHMISDGRGALEFFKTLIALYCQARYGVSGNWAGPGGTFEQRTEDSFARHYERKRAASASMPKAVHLVGWRNDSLPKYWEYHLKASEVHGLAKGMDVSVTSLLMAVVIASIGRSLEGRQGNREICINMPVDLRRFFGSETLRNFFGLSYVSYPAQKATDPIDLIASSVQGQLRKAVDPDAIKRRMNRMVRLERSPLLRFAPLFMKDFALDIADAVSARQVTTTVSNLGVVGLPDAVACYVRNVNVLTATKSIDFTICSFGDDLSIGISSVYVSNAIPRDVCRIFAGLGVTGYLNTNEGCSADAHSCELTHRGGGRAPATETKGEAS